MNVLATESVQVVVDQLDPFRKHGVCRRLRLGYRKQFQGLARFVTISFHLTPVGFAVGEECVHCVGGWSVETFAVFVEEFDRVLVFAAPVHSSGKVREEVVVTDSVLAEVHRQPDVFAA